MRSKPHMHKFGHYNVWFGPSIKATWKRGCPFRRQHTHSWLAAPIASGQCADAAVRIHGLNGQPGAVARKLADREWEVTGFDYKNRQTTWTVYAKTRQEALIIADIERGLEVTRYHHSIARPGFADGRFISVRYDKDYTKPSDHWQWVEVLRSGRPRKGGGLKSEHGIRLKK